MSQTEPSPVADVIVLGSPGVQLQLRLQPNSSQIGLREICPQYVRWAVRQKPVDGLANKALIKSLSDTLGLPRSQISIRSGLHSRNKVVFIADATKEQVLEQICPPSP